MEREREKKKKGENPRRTKKRTQTDYEERNLEREKKQPSQPAPKFIFKKYFCCSLVQYTVYSASSLFLLERKIKYYHREKARK